ncbi:MAG: glycosyltransferase family 4 protein, partial [Thermomonas sp.]
MTPDRQPAPAVWFPTLAAGTGADVFTQRLCDALEARGIRAQITWLHRRAEYLPWTVAAPTPPGWANVVHLNSWLPRRFWPPGIPTVVTVHHLVHDPAYRQFRSPAQAAYHALVIRPRESRAIRDAGAVTTVSGYVSRTVEAFSGRQDVKVIHNWVDTETFSPVQGGAADKFGPFRLFMAGGRTRRKGYDLLPAFVAALGPGFEIRYAGGIGAAGSPVPGVVDLGRISAAELVREYRATDAVVSLSRYEGFGYTALEGMACGKPFVGFGGGGLVDVVEDGVHG